MPFKNPRVAKLEEELEKRLGLRAFRDVTSQDGCAWPAVSHFASPEQLKLQEAYANLDLSPGTSVREVGRAYRRLMYVFHPDRHRGDPVTHRLAEELARHLAIAYSTITAARRTAR